MKKYFLLLLLLLASAAQAQNDSAIIHSVTLLTENPLRYAKVELLADIDARFANPYDPADIRIDGRFTAPSGQVIVVPGFYYRDFTENDASLTPTSERSWRVRFTPTETGDYRYQLLVTTQTGTTRSASQTFTVAESDRHGFVRLDERNPRYFAFDDGTPYFPIGENMGWSNGNPLVDYEKWLDDLQAAGGNFVRVWMPPWGFSIEWLDTGLGNYDARQAQAYQLDRLVDMLDERGIYMMLSLINHGQFSETTNAEWDQNPYNAANGGPCAEPGCFASDPDAIRYWNQRLRYIAARWGYSTSIMSWEWWNEVNWTQMLQPELLTPWMARSGAYLRSLDPYQHLITHSGSPVNNETVWEQTDFTQEHRYNMTNLLNSFDQTIPEWLDAYPDKPFMIGEFGSPLEIDSLGVLMHLGMWSAAMHGSVGSGMTWYWDDHVDRLDLYPHFAGMAAFFAGEDLAAQQWQPAAVEFAQRAAARVYGLQTDDAALLWVVNRDYSNQQIQKTYNDAIRDAIRAGNSSSSLAYSFEDGLDGWTLAEASTAQNANVAPAADQAADGSSSLALSGSFEGSTRQEVTAFVQPDADWSASTQITLDVYAPEGATDFSAQVYAETGTDAAEGESQNFALTPGQWNHLTVQLGQLGDLTDVRQFGVRIGTSIRVFEGTFYVDNLRFGNQPEIVYEFPAVEGAALTLTGVQERNYTVEVWDTISGAILETDDLGSADGMLTIPLPSFEIDLALKVRPT
ncbi:MAG: DUF5060 domain-containing protein [Chloroflexota bacterium]